MNISVEEKIRKEAHSLYPVPLSPAQTSSFIKKQRKLGLPDELVELGWIKFKSEHISCWRKRYGLDDRLPFKMEEGELALECTWIYSEAGMSYNLKLKGQQPVRGLIPGSMSETKVKLKKLLVAQNEKYGLLYNEFLLVGNRGEVFNFTYPVCEHDWDFWKSKILTKLNINKSTLSKLVNQFVSPSCTQWASVQEFEEFLTSSYKETN